VRAVHVVAPLAHACLGTGPVHRAACAAQLLKAFLSLFYGFYSILIAFLKLFFDFISFSNAFLRLS